jgi:hypothetical protein
MSTLTPAWLLLALVQTAADAEVPRFAPFEQTFHHTGNYENPYVQLEPAALLTGPRGDARKAPLFWDGDTAWKLRFAPDTCGTWKWSVGSSDPGLNGRSGSFRVVDSDRPGGLRPIKNRPHHFQRQDGTPFWFMGDTGWALYTDSEPEKHNRRAVEKYVDTRARQGFNVIHSMLLSEAGWGNRGGDAFFDLGERNQREGDGKIRSQSFKASGTACRRRLVEQLVEQKHAVASCLLFGPGLAPRIQDHNGEADDP